MQRPLNSYKWQAVSAVDLGVTSGSETKRTLVFSPVFGVTNTYPVTVTAADGQQLLVAHTNIIITSNPSNNPTIHHSPGGAEVDFQATENGLHKLVPNTQSLVITAKAPRKIKNLTLRDLCTD